MSTLLLFPVRFKLAVVLIEFSLCILDLDRDRVLDSVLGKKVPLERLRVWLRVWVLEVGPDFETEVA